MVTNRLLANAFEKAEDYKTARVDALVYESFDGLPACLFIVAELDPLRDGNLGMTISQSCCQILY